MASYVFFVNLLEPIHKYFLLRKKALAHCWHHVPQASAVIVSNSVAIEGKIF